MYRFHYEIREFTGRFWFVSVVHSLELGPESAGRQPSGNVLYIIVNVDIHFNASRGGLTWLINIARRLGLSAIEATLADTKQTIIHLGACRTPICEVQ